MTKDRKLPHSQKSQRPSHERFKDLYAKEHAATTPELANRAPRQVAQSVTPNTSDGTTTTTANSNGRSGGECTPATGKTPIKKKKPPKRSKKATKWAHVPSASDGDATHFENFENDGGAQMAVAKMKTRKLQWSRETIEADDEPVDETDAGESFKEEIGGSAGGGYTRDSGSAGGELAQALPALERTQEDEKWRDEVKKDLIVDEPDAKNEKKLLSPTPSPPKPKEGGGGSKEALKEATTKEAGKTVKEAKTQAPTARSPQKPAKEKSPTKPKEAPKTTAAQPQPKPKQQENTKREQKAVLPPKQPEKSRAEQRNATTPKKEVTTRESKKPVAVVAVPAKAPVPAPPIQTPAPVPKRPPSESTATDATKSTVETKREAKQTQHPQTGVTTRSKEPASANYRLAVKLMKILKRNNYLENALRFEEGERVRKHFEANGFATQPPAPILALLNQALNFALETVLFRADDLDTQITNDLRVFIIKKNEARLAMLEVCFNRPDLMPNKWGGARKDGKRSKSSTKTREGGKRGWFASLFGRGEK